MGEGGREEEEEEAEGKMGEGGREEEEAEGKMGEGGREEEEEEAEGKTGEGGREEEEEEKEAGGYLILRASNSTMLNTYKNLSTILVFVSGYSEELWNEKYFKVGY